eukprot:snap_masked-scaffold_2-processed-gene-9.37-mRNA-1 protein AED:0.19 eAED:1.00 QI:0/-1/0/1/-1/1/1/0/659
MSFPPSLLNTWVPNPTPTRGERFALASNATGSYLVYPSGKSVVLRSFDTPSLAISYSTTRSLFSTAAFAHNDPQFLAGADKTGMVYQLKLNTNLLSTDSALDNTKEYNIMGIGGQIHDICFTSDDKHIVVGGSASTKKGKGGNIFNLGGNPVGTDTNLGSGNRIWTCTVSNTLPLNKSVIFMGTDKSELKPYIKGKKGFKILSKTIKHSGPVTMARFHPQDSCILSAGGKDILLNDFKIPEGDSEDYNFGLKKKIAGGLKGGRIYAVAWNEGSQFMRVGTDKIVKIYDAETGAESNAYNMKGAGNHQASSHINDFQVACTFAGQYPVSMSLGGDLFYFDTRQSTPTRCVSGTTAPIADVCFDETDNSLGVINKKGEMLLYSGVDSGDVKVLRAEGIGETKTGSGVAKFGADLFTTSNADTLQHSVIEDGALKLVPGATPLGSKPVYTRKIKNGAFAVATVNSVLIIDGGKPVATFEKAEHGLGQKDISCAAMSPSMNILAVGFTDRSLKFFDADVAGKKFTERASDATQLEEMYGFPNCMSFNKAGKYLAIGCKKCIKLYEVSGNSLIIRSGDGVERLEQHAGKILDLDFGGEGDTMLLSSEANTKVLLWDVTKHEEALPQTMDRPHGVRFINRVRWVSKTEFITVGQDVGDIMKWRLS